MEVLMIAIVSGLVLGYIAGRLRQANGVYLDGASGTIVLRLGWRYYLRRPHAVLPEWRELKVIRKLGAGAWRASRGRHLVAMIERTKRRAFDTLAITKGCSTVARMIGQAGVEHARSMVARRGVE